MKRRKVAAWFRLPPRERRRREHERLEKARQRAAAHAAIRLLRADVDVFSVAKIKEIVLGLRTGALR